MSDKPQESVIVDILTEDVHKHFMRQTAKTVRDIALDVPMDSFPSLDNFAQSGMTPPSRAKSMRVVAKARLKVGVE
jgi:hypothetical protein